MTALEDLIPVTVVAGSNKLQKSKRVTVEVRRFAYCSDRALSNAVRNLLGGDWTYRYTPTGF